MLKPSNWEIIIASESRSRSFNEAYKVLTETQEYLSFVLIREITERHEQVEYPSLRFVSRHSEFARSARNNRVSTVGQEV